MSSFLATAGSKARPSVEPGVCEADMTGMATSATITVYGMHCQLQLCFFVLQVMRFTNNSFPC